MKPEIKIQNNGSTWRIIIDATDAHPSIPEPMSTYDMQKQRLGVLKTSESKRQKLLQEFGLLGLSERKFDHYREEMIIREFDSFYHAGATSAKELNWANDEHSVGYFWSTKEKLLVAFEKQFLNFLLQRGHIYKGKKGGAMSQAKAMAKAKFDALENVQDFVDYKRLQVSPQNLDECTMAGTVSAERPDDTGQYVNAGSGSLGGGYLQAGVAKQKAMSGI